MNIALKAVALWLCVGDDHYMWSLCVVSYSSYDLGCMDNVEHVNGSVNFMYMCCL